MVKGAKTIAEYAIRKWLQNENFAMENFRLEMNGNEGLLTDKDGDSITLIYDSSDKEVRVI